MNPGAVDFNNFFKEQEYRGKDLTASDVSQESDCDNSDESSCHSFFSIDVMNLYFDETCFVNHDTFAISHSPHIEAGVVTVPHRPPHP